ncbi:MAG: alpha/beta hydrolase [Eubacteriales bacterium]
MKKNKSIILVIALGFTTIYAGVSFFFRAFIDRRGLKKIPFKKIDEGNAVTWKKYKPKLDVGYQWFENQNPTEHVMTSYDGLQLKGWYLPCEDAVRTVMCVHGYRGSGKKEFGYVSQFFHAQKSNVFIIDHRAHGESEGKYICYGTKERKDCVDWLYYLNDRYGDNIPLYLDGISMGGATVMMTSNMDLPDNMAGIIADCGFTSHLDIAGYIMEHEFKMPKFPFLQLSSVWCRIKAGYWPGKVSATECVRESKVPILFVHGTDDSFVPYFMTEINYEACTSEKMLHAVEGAGHALSYMMDEENCQKTMLKFFDRCENK